MGFNQLDVFLGNKLDKKLKGEILLRGARLSDQQRLVLTGWSPGLLTAEQASSLLRRLDKPKEGDADNTNKQFMVENWEVQQQMQSTAPPVAVPTQQLALMPPIMDASWTLLQQNDHGDNDSSDSEISVDVEDREAAQPSAG